MVGKSATARDKGKGRASNAIPEVYQDMLADALPLQPNIPERPLKRRRVGGQAKIATSKARKENDQEDDEDVEFEDVLILQKSNSSDSETDDDSDAVPKTQQTAYRGSDDSDSEDIDWEAIHFQTTAQEEPSGDLELTLKARPTPQRKVTAPRRKAITKEDRAIRLQQHKMHVLCLLAFVERRNDWCCDEDVKASLKPLLTSKMIKYLNPGESLSQFGRANSLKTGLDDVAKRWRAKFKITARGMRRALWAEDEKDLQDYALPDEADPVFEKEDFRAAAKTLRGSRDVGAQLFCALLRSAGIEARLVCSLQVLSFTAGGPAMQRSVASSRKAATSQRMVDNEDVHVTAETFVFGTPGGSDSPPAPPQRRLGHPNAAGYNIPGRSGPSRPAPSRPPPQTIFESPYPVFWVEVLDVAHQKWLPVDPLVTDTINKPYNLEPPATDRENSLSYVIAFDDERVARDVTMRYTKTYAAKIRKTRVESTQNGERWWRKTMRYLSRGLVPSTVDQIETTELKNLEEREPMPRNIADFKDHPRFALERHLRRNEILVGNHSVGTVAVGKDSGTPGKKKLEHVFRRSAVKIVRNSEAWYKLGREVRMGEQPTKVLPPKASISRDDDDDDEENDEADINLYTEDQTDPYVSPPVVNGLVPKNSFGNLDLYVPSMIPQGGVHISDELAARAAHILGIDYSPALTGWRWQGSSGGGQRRKGQPILTGAVVASEYHDAVEAVIEGVRDAAAQAEEERRARVARGVWNRWLAKLRIKARVDSYAVEGEERDGGGGGGVGEPGEEDDDDDDDEDEPYEDDGAGMESEEYEVDEMGGGFFVE